MNEVEAKFSVHRPDSLERAARLKILGPFRWIKSGRQKQWNRYWDTADRRLHRARAALKLRRVGRRAEMTFKQELRYRNGVSERIEVTAPVSLPAGRQVPGEAGIRRLLERRPFIPPVRRARALIGRRPLQEVLCLRTDRRIRWFAVDRRAAAGVELALDRVEVLQDGRVVGAFCEIELEKRGAKERVFRHAVLDLRRRLGSGVRVSRTPKYGTALHLLQLEKR